eukprot:2995738-Rhodomonas_salina.1
MQRTVSRSALKWRALAVDSDSESNVRAVHSAKLSGQTFLRRNVHHTAQTHTVERAVCFHNEPSNAGKIPQGIPQARPDRARQAYN